MESNISATNFIKQVNYFHACYCDTIKFGMNPLWKFWGVGLIDHVRFHWEFDENLNDILYFGIYEEDDHTPEVLVYCKDGSSEIVYMAIVKGLEEYFCLKTGLE